MESCRNDHFYDLFTCPRCYADMRGRFDKLDIQCHGCGCMLECTVDYIPSARTTVIEGDEP